MRYPQIAISLQQKELHLIQSDAQEYRFPIAIGKPETPTPKGTWHVQNKKILSDPGPFGTHWIGLNLPGYGIHGTNQTNSIGTAASGGCIRMHNHDVQYVFGHISIGTVVMITD